MSQIHSNSIESLRAAITALENLYAINIVGEFRKFEHSRGAGTYCAIVLDPSSGKTHTVNEASKCCSANEYFGESGELSRQTLLSSTRACDNPGPDDGFEWDGDGDDYVWDGTNPDSWIGESDCSSLIKSAEKILRAKLGLALAEAILPEAFQGDYDNAKRFLLECGWKEFGISDIPVNGWVPDGYGDADVSEVEGKISSLMEAIREEIARLEEELSGAAD